MIFKDLHTHSCFCDGKNSPEEIVLAAIGKGLKTIGVVVHSYTSEDDSYCVKKENVKVFQAEMARLKVKYADKIEVLCGVEQDCTSTFSTEGFDYVIGSVHYFRVDGKLYNVDHSREELQRIVNDVFDGDYYAAVENYFESVKSLVGKFKLDIVGHFDLICKFNKGGALFDENHPRFINAFKSALDTLIPLNVPFEINTGAIARGYQDKPYPLPCTYSAIKARGGRFVISSDSHNKENLAFEYDKWKFMLD